MKIFNRVWVLIPLMGLLAVSCKTTENASGEEPDEADVRALYQELIDKQGWVNSEYSDGTSQQPRDLERISPRLADDPYFKRSLEHKNVAEIALLDMAWSEAKKYFEHAFGALQGFFANRLIVQAEELLKVIRRRGLDKAYPKEFQKGVSAFSSAQSSLDAGWFKKSVSHAQMAVDAFRRVHAGLIFVNKYTIISGDCLWRISSKKDIYNDAYRWPKIYMANRSKFRNPDNPDLIYPGQVFDIPRY